MLISRVSAEKTLCKSTCLAFIKVPCGGSKETFLCLCYCKGILIISFTYSEVQERRLYSVCKTVMPLKGQWAWFREIVGFFMTC